MAERLQTALRSPVERSYVRVIKTSFMRTTFLCILIGCKDKFYLSLLNDIPVSNPGPYPET